MLDAFAAVAQGLLYIGVALSLGGVFADASLHPTVDLRRTLRRLATQGSVILIAATLTALGILMLRLGDTLDAAIATAVLTSNVGGAAGVRLAGAVLILALPNTDDDGFSRGMRVTSAVIIAASFLFSGHAAAEGLALGVLAAVHVTIAGWWFCSLIVLRSACESAGSEVTALVRRFSVLAIWAVAVLVLAGALLILGLIDVTAFTFTPYVRNLGIKLAIVAVVLALASYNKFALTARVLAHEQTAIARLRRSIEVELGLLVAVLIATSIMTTYTSPHE